MKSLFEELYKLLKFHYLSEAEEILNKIDRKKLSTKDLLTLEYLEFQWNGLRGSSRITFSSACELFEKSKKMGDTEQQIQHLINLFINLRVNNDPLEYKKQNFNKYLPIAQELLKSINNNEKKSLIEEGGWLNFQLGHFYEEIFKDYLTGNNYFQEAMKWFKEISLALGICWIEFSRATTYSKKGELTESLRHFEKSLRIADEITHPWLIIKSLIYKSILYSYKGEFNLSLETSSEALQEIEHFGDKINSYYYNYQYQKWMVESNRAEILADRGDLKAALNLFEKQLPLLVDTKEKFINKELSIINCLYNLIQFGLEFYSETKLNDYLNQMEKVIFELKQPTQLIRQRYRICRGLLLKNSDRLQEIAKAQELFREVANEPIEFFEDSIKAMRFLGESLLYEFKITQSETVFNEFIEIINQMESIAKKENSHWILIYVYILQAKLELIRFNFPEFQNILTKAQILAKEKEFSSYLYVIQNEKTQFEEQIGLWKQRMDENPSLVQLISDVQLEKYLKEAKIILSDQNN